MLLRNSVQLRFGSQSQTLKIKRRVSEKKSKKKVKKKEISERQRKVKKYLWNQLCNFEMFTRYFEEIKCGYYLNSTDDFAIHLLPIFCFDR